MILCKEHRSVRKKQAATPSKVTACFVLLLILFRKVGHNAVGSDISFAHRLGKLIGTTGAVPGGKTAGLVGSHLPINSDIGAVQFQTAQQGARGNGVAQDENPVQIQDSTVCQGNSCHGFLSANGFQLSGIYRNVFPDDLTIGIRREQVHLGGNFRQVNDLMFKFP